MKMSYLIIFIIIIIGISSQCCEKDKIEIETDPTKIIIGKWEEIEIGNWPQMISIKALGCEEYLSDRFCENMTMKNKYTPSIKNTG
jgi:hypothetical protein